MTTSTATTANPDQKACNRTLPSKRPVKANSAPVPFEEADHKALADYLRLAVPRGTIWFHIPNGGLRNIATAAKLKKMGTLAGVPDLQFIHDGKITFLELKRRTGGRVSPEQIALHDDLRSAGATVLVARGFDDAVAALRGAGLCR